HLAADHAGKNPERAAREEIGVRARRRPLMRAFDFLQPRSVAEASAMLNEHGEGARPLAGGTSLVLLLRQRLAEPSHVVHIGNLAELRGIRIGAEGELRIGALATHAEVAAHPLIRERFAVIAEMA